MAIKKCTVLREALTLDPTDPLCSLWFLLIAHISIHSYYCGIQSLTLSVAVFLKSLRLCVCVFFFLPAQVLECGVCEDVFSLQGDKVPRLLLCGHTVCHDCLTRLPLHGRAVRCPFDRQVTELGELRGLTLFGIWLLCRHGLFPESGYHRGQMFRRSGRYKLFHPGGADT